MSRDPYLVNSKKAQKAAIIGQVAFFSICGLFAYVACLQLTITAIVAQHCLGGGGLKVQAKRAKRDHIGEIGS